jgi:GrpB-like predicted nucleotidyltransferase (UPF0157 family)
VPRPVTLVTNIGRGRWQTALVPATSHALRHVGATTDEPGLIHITLLPHDPAWARRYARERDRICCALGGRAVRIEHVGSTAVPGLKAKPVVDVMVTVADVDADAAWLPALEAAGYVLAVRERRHCLLRTADGAVEVHVWTAGSDDERRQLLFRERLRRSPRLRRQYEALKRELAERPWPTADAYAEAKGPFIERALARPRAA